MGLIDKSIPRPTPLSGSLGGIASHLATRVTGQMTTAAMAAGVRTLEQATGMRFDPAPAYLFFVELSGVFVALFTECSGLEVKRDVATVEEGGVNNYVHKLPGRLKFENITLKRGISLSRALWDWMMQGRYDFQVRRLNFSIVQGAPGHNLISAATTAAGGATDTTMTMMGQGFGKVKHWDVEDAYPARWKLSDLDTSSAKAAIETLEIAHHGLSLSYETLTPMSAVGGAAGLISL
jgi:phage tail-like protein